jgi:DNA-binding transcriptional LysR family regulator
MIKSKIDRVQDIEIFLCIIERGSLTGAASVFDLSVPQISKRISKLEESLGAHLIDRSSKTLVLTEAGREFYDHAVSIVEAIKSSEEALSTAADQIRGTLRISVPTAAAEVGIISDFVDLILSNDKLSIEIYLSDRPTDIIRHGLDAAIYLTDAPDRHPGDIILAQHPTSLAASPSYLDKYGRPNVPEDLERHRTIRAVSSKGIPADWELTHNSGKKNIIKKSSSMFLSDEVRVLYTATVCGAGIGRMPIGYINKAALSRQLELVLPEWRFRPIMVAASLRRPGMRSKKIDALFGLAKTVLERINSFSVNSTFEHHHKAQSTSVKDLHSKSNDAATGYDWNQSEI